MTSGTILPSLLAALLALPAVARADSHPDFENDALPILRQQPGLVEYVHSHYVVKETGLAQSAGSANEAPRPPYIFSARPRGKSGPFYLRLLIQPGPPGHILKVADIRTLPSGVEPRSPAPVEAETTAPSAPPATDAPPANPAPAPSSSSTEPTSSTPSGPIKE